MNAAGIAAAIRRFAAARNITDGTAPAGPEPVPAGAAAAQVSPEAAGAKRYCPSCKRLFWVPAGASIPVHIANDVYGECPGGGKSATAAGPGTGRTDAEQEAHEAAAWFRYAAARDVSTAQPGSYPGNYRPDSVPDHLFYDLLTERDAAWTFRLASHWPRGRWERYGTAHTRDGSDGDADQAALYATSPSPEVLGNLAALALDGNNGECPACGSDDRMEAGYVPGFTGMPVTCTDDWHPGDAHEPGSHNPPAVLPTTLEVALARCDAATAGPETGADQQPQDTGDGAQRAAQARLEQWAPGAQGAAGDGAFDVWAAGQDERRAS